MFLSFKTVTGAREVTQQVRVLAFLTEDLSLFPSTHLVAHNPLALLLGL